MKVMTSISAGLMALALVGCGQGQQNVGSASPTPLSEIAGSWSLDGAASKIAFASIKVDELIETHYFPGLSGEISESGETVITIPLAEVETKIDLRNERMQSMFFETETYPEAEIRVSVDRAEFSNLAIGERLETEVEGTLSLHGVESYVYASVFVTRIADARVEVSTSEPVVVHVADFNLEAGLEALREVAGLTSITPAVPVTFSLVFDAADA